MLTCSGPSMPGHRPLPVPQALPHALRLLLRVPSCILTWECHRTWTSSHRDIVPGSSPVGHLHHRHLMKGALCPALARTGLGWVPVLFGSGRCLVTASGPVSLPTFLYCFIVEGILLTTRCMHAVSSDLTRVGNIPVSLNRGHFFVLGTFESLSSSSSIHMVLCCMRNCPIVP